VKQRTFTLLGFGPKTRISMQETTAKWELKIMLAMEVPDRQTLLKSHLAFLTFAQRILAALCASSRRDLAVLVRSCFARISCPHLLEFRQRIHFQRLRRRSRFSSMRARFSSSMMLRMLVSMAYAKVDAKVVKRANGAHTKQKRPDRTGPPILDQSFGLRGCPKRFGSDGFGMGGDFSLSL
jgi:hypothetical protein